MNPLVSKYLKEIVDYIDSLKEIVYDGYHSHDDMVWNKEEKYWHQDYDDYDKVNRLEYNRALERYKEKISKYSPQDPVYEDRSGSGLRFHNYNPPAINPTLDKVRKRLQEYYRDLHQHSCSSCGLNEDEQFDCDSWNEAISNVWKFIEKHTAEECTP